MIRCRLTSSSFSEYGMKCTSRYAVSGVSGANRQHRTGANLVEHTPGTILSKANYRNQIKTAGLLDVPLRHHLPALIA